MSERTRGSYDDALYKSTYILYYILSGHFVMNAVNATYSQNVAIN